MTHMPKLNKMRHEKRFYTKDGVASSVVFVIENRELHASKEVLALCSPVFRRMFESDFRERSAEYILLPDKNYSDMAEFLLCIYPDTLKPLSDETVFNVLSLADEYQVELQIKRCIEYLSKKCNDPNATLTEQVNILLCAERYSLKELYNACFDTVSKASPNLLKQVNEFVKLSEETREKFKRLRSQALDIKLTDGNVHDVLRAASDYEEEDLVKKCEQHLIARCKKTDKPLVHGLVSMISAADTHRLAKLKEEVMELAIKRKSYDLEASPIYKTLAPETRYKIVSKRVKIFEQLFGKLTKLRCHCCRKHSDYNCKICFITVTKEAFQNAGMSF